MREIVLDFAGDVVRLTFKRVERHPCVDFTHVPWQVVSAERHQSGVIRDLHMDRYLSRWNRVLYGVLIFRPRREKLIVRVQELVCVHRSGFLHDAVLQERTFSFGNVVRICRSTSRQDDRYENHCQPYHHTGLSMHFHTSSPTGTPARLILLPFQIACRATESFAHSWSHRLSRERRHARVMGRFQTRT